jgi:hypothetical protein
VEFVEPVYNNIKVIILVVIFAVISLNSLIKTPAQGKDIIRLIIYSSLSTNKKAEY